MCNQKIIQSYIILFCRCKFMALIGRIFKYMPSNKKPRKKYTGKYAKAVNNIAMAKEGASLIDASQKNAMLSFLTANIETLINGDQNYDSWLNIKAAIELSQEIEKQGVIKGYSAEIEFTLSEISELYNIFAHYDQETNTTLWIPSKLNSNIIDQLKFFKRIFEHQIKSLSVKEYEDVYGKLIRKKQSQT